MNANTFLPNEQHIMPLRPQPSANAPGAVVLGTAERGAPAVAHPLEQNEEMCPDSCRVGSSLGTIQEMSRAFDQPNAALARKELESQIHQNYFRVEKNTHCRTGANRFRAYLEGEQRSLAEVTKWDLQEWARTPIASGKAKGKMLSERVFRGAKGLCAFAAQVGYIDALRANDIAECTRPLLEVNVLRSQLQNPMLTSEECASLIYGHFQVAEKSTNRLAGANAFLAYWQSQKKPLVEVSTSDLGGWALIPLSQGDFKSNLPNRNYFEGAKAFCALAAEVGYIQTHSAKDFAAYTRPQCDLGTLCRVLQNTELTRREHENQLRLYYQSVDNQPEHHAGAQAILEHLESQGRSLAEVSTGDLERWALTPVTTGTGKLKVPSVREFGGAKLFCALAAEVGYIDVQRAKQLAEFKRPQFGVETLRTLLQNTALTVKERESHICLNYQSSESNGNRHAGATAFFAYLENAKIPLSEVSTADLRQWALTPLKGTRNLPEPRAFEGAKALCALAAQVGHIDAQRAEELATYPLPHVELDSLRMLLQNSELTRKGREHQIHLTYQSLDRDFTRQCGAKGIMEYLEKQGRSLAEVTTSDLKEWALTPSATGRGKGTFPSLRAIQGAKALCTLAAEVGYIDAQRAQNIAQCPRPQAEVGSLRRLIQNPDLTPKERDYHLSLHYQLAEKDVLRQVGARRFLAYLESQAMTLAEASKSDLESWALKPSALGIRQKKLPTMPAFEGAQALCALAAEVGLIDGPQAHGLATCARPRFDLASLHMVVQNPAATRKEREVQICLKYQSSEKDRHSVTGAKAFLTFLDGQQRSLAEVSKSDLEEWALRPLDSVRAKGSLPSRRAFDGAKALCAVAAEIEYIDAQTAQDIAECPHPHYDSDLLRSVLENPALTRHEREYEICLNYHSTEKDVNRQGGMNGFLAYLEDQGSSLADVTKRDLEQWALTPISSGRGKGTFPSLRAIQGAKGLCARAAEVGYIEAQRAADIAECTLPQPGGLSTSEIDPSEAGLDVAESSTGMLERVNKRLKIDDQGASPSLFHCFAFPQSDALFREFALSPPSLFESHEHMRSPQTGSTLSRIDELESLEDILASAGQLYE